MPGDMSGGHNMVSIEDGNGGDAAAAGGRNGAASATDAENQDALNESSGDENLNGSEEAGAAPEDAGQEEGAPGAQDGDPNGEGADGEGDGKPGPLDPDALREDILKAVDERLKPQEQAKPMTEEDWAKKEEEWGCSRQTIQAFTQQSVKVYNMVKDYVDTMFAGVHKDSAIQTIAREPGFSDAIKYRKEIDTYLSKFNPKFHNNPQVLKDAVIYARGLAASKNIQKASNMGERNRRLGGAARPASPGSNGARRPSAPVLNRSQKEAAQKFNMTEAEYSKLLSKRGTPVAV